MDSVGYALEEVVGLLEFQDHFSNTPRWKKIARIVVALLSLGILAGFGTYQVLRTCSPSIDLFSFIWMGEL